MHHQVGWILYGTGGNGKDQFLNVLRNISGNGHIEIDIGNLSRNQYALSELPNKKVVVCSETVSDPVADAYLKRMITGESMEVRGIYKQPINITPICKIWWAVNELPKVRDLTDGYWRRWKVIPFTQTFDESRRDIDLQSKLQAESSGIFNWALEGLRRLNTRGKFPTAKTIEEITAHYRLLNDTTAYFVEKTCVRVSSEKESPLPLYKRYEEFADENDFEPVGFKNFGADLVRLGFPRIKQKERWYSGISFVKGGLQ